MPNAHHLGRGIRLDVAPLGSPGMAAAAPPSEFLVWAWGDIETSKGTFLFDAKAAASVMESYLEHGNELFIDYQHLGVDPGARAGDGRAAGWFRPEVRTDGLWAAGVTWTPAAEEGLRNREWRYFSPAFTTDPENRVIALTNIALTNLPATRNMQPLMAHRLTEDKMNPEQDKTTDDLIPDSAAPAAAPADEAKQARATAALRAAQAYLKKCEEDAKSLGVVLDEAAPSGDNDQAADDLPSDGPTADGADKETADDASVPDGYKDDPYAGAGDGKDGGDQESDDTEDEDGKDGGKAQAVARLAQLGRFTMQALRSKNTSEARGKLRALSQRVTASAVTLDARVQRLESDLAKYRATEKKRSVEAVVANGVQLGKITPAMRSWALSLGTKDLTELKAYIAAAPAIVQTMSRSEGGARPTTEAGRPPATASVTLSDDEKKICKITGVTTDAFIARKKANASR